MRLLSVTSNAGFSVLIFFGAILFRTTYRLFRRPNAFRFLYLCRLDSFYLLLKTVRTHKTEYRNILRGRQLRRCLFYWLYRRLPPLCRIRQAPRKQARFHNVRCGVIAYQRSIYTCVCKLKARKARALQKRSCLIREHTYFMPVFRRHIYGCQSCSVLYRRKPARIAVGQNTVAVLEKICSVFTDLRHTSISLPCSSKAFSLSAALTASAPSPLCKRAVLFISSAAAKDLPR